ncbi:MAG: pantoate--beta-alanine ligase [Myxococcaceae bacterium]|nr:pantoate--beta-alanine ligase [Myxococcaceae bacterium]MCI0673780.1 pantoate--beta-alanine ligase [Myxococcaceae bacterium]
MATLTVLKTPREAAAWAKRVRRAGQRLALVPTMGALHEGHLSLVREGLRRADVVLVSIFVNPTQFGPTEDLARYPRDLEGDVAKCAEAGAAAVYAPEPGMVYPPGYQTYVEVGELSQGLCGARRPGHFRGVATVVTKLFALLRPHVALFGEKDYQQLQVITALAQDLELGVEVVGMPTVREPDGLAMSSRNRYLGAEDRRRALSLSQGLFDAQAQEARGVRDAESLRKAVRDRLDAANVKEDYVELVDARTLKPLERVETGHAARLLVAAFVGATRLIDNVPVPREGT